MRTVLKTVLAALALATVAFVCSPHAQTRECTKIEVLLKDAAENAPDVQVANYTGAEAERIIGVARDQSGRADALEGANGVTVVTSAALGVGVIAITKDGCVALVGRSTTDFIRSILETAKVGGST